MKKAFTLALVIGCLQATAQAPYLLKDIIGGNVGGFTTSNQYFYSDHPFSVVWEKNGVIYFTAIGYNSVPNGSSATNDVELWMSDGTTGGTMLLKDINPGNEGSYPSEFTEINGILYFTAYTNAGGKELWKTDGTQNGTVMVKDIISGNVGGFQTSAQFGYNPLAFSVVWQNGNEFFFIANNYASAPGNYVNDVELWKSDGTDAGTVMVKDIYQGNESSYPQDFNVVNNTLYFTAYNSTSGQELWKTDGTTNGTVLVKEIIAGNVGGFQTSAQFGYNIWPFSIVWQNGSTFYFTANNYASAPNNYINDVELWKSDGTDAGTVMIKDIYPGYESSYPMDFHEINGTLYFTAHNSATGRELWKTDGTNNGTVIIKEIIAGGIGGFETAVQFGYAPMTFDVVWQTGSTFYFLANNYASIPSNYINDVELWKSDGTDAGTVMVKDIYPGYESSYPRDFHDINGTLYFTAYNATSGQEIWRTDGTTNGTTLVKEIISGSVGGFQLPAQFGYNIYPFNVIWQSGNTFYFRACGYVDPIGGSQIADMELWKSDGTSSGTQLVKDIEPGNNGSYPESFNVINGKLYFTAENSSSGRELWKTDGTNAGTEIVKEIIPGNVGGFQTASYNTYNTQPFYIPFNIGSYFYFVANDYASVPNGSNFSNNMELWKSDGSTGGTTKVMDIHPSTTEGSFPQYFNNRLGKVFFTAYEPANGRELWTMDLPVSDEMDATINDSFWVYPNPVSSQLNLKYTSGKSGPETFHVTITDLSGRAIMSSGFTADKSYVHQTLDVEKLSPGVYFVRIESTNLRETRKFVKE